MIYKSNLGTVIGKLNAQLREVKDTDPLLRRIAVSLATSNTNRIHNESKDLSGAEITYKPSRKTPQQGAYSKGYAKLRRAKGKQINKVNLSFTGKLSTEFMASEIAGGWGVGFISSSTGDLRKFLEDKYGDLWGISTKDRQAIERILSKVIKKQLGT